MAQNKVFRGVHTSVTRPTPNSIEGFYRGTKVASLTTFEDGLRTIYLNNGGWMTATTKLRMNQFAAEFCDNAFSVYQKDREWYVRRGDKAQRFHGQSITFII